MCFFFGCWIFFSKRERGKFTRNTEIGHEVRIHLSLRDKFDLNFSKKKNYYCYYFIHFSSFSSSFAFFSCFYFVLFFFFLSFHQFTVDSMKASITHAFGCYIQYPKSSIRIGVKVIGIFVLRKQKKTKPKEKKTNFVDLRITK